MILFLDFVLRRVYLTGELNPGLELVEHVKFDRHFWNVLLLCESCQHLPVLKIVNDDARTPPYAVEQSSRDPSLLGRAHQ